jgi:glutathionyl-hydroquinone reductase
VRIHLLIVRCSRLIDVLAQTWTNKVSREPGAQFPAEKGRYHLYVGLFCPCEFPNAPDGCPVDHAYCLVAHRTLILLKLKGISEDIISTSVVHWFKGIPGTSDALIHYLRALITRLDENGVFPGWHFATEEEQAATPGCTPDHLYGSYWLSEIYRKANPEYDGKYTVPVLWDKKTETIVNNESLEIMRLLSTEFDEYVFCMRILERVGLMI